MRESWGRVDDALIDRVFQPLVDAISQHMPMNCFRMACVSTDLAALAWIVSQAQATTVATGSGVLGFEAFQFSLILLGLGAITLLRTPFERMGGTGGGTERANPLRPGMYVHRLACLLWLAVLAAKTAAAPVGLGSVALFSVGIFVTAAVYIGACSSRPHKRSQRFGRQWGVGQPEQARMSHLR